MLDNRLDHIRRLSNETLEGPDRGRSGSPLDSHFHKCGDPVCFIVLLAGAF